MKIDGIYTHEMRNDVHFQFHTEVRKLLLKYDPEEMRIKDVFDDYDALYAKEDLAFKKINKSAITKKIHDADKARDMVWYLMIEAVKVGLKHYNEDILDAAYKVMIVLNTYGKVPQKTLHEQTSALYNVLQELLSNYSTEIALLNIAPLIAELQNRNNVFAELVRERHVERTNKTDIVMKEIRAKVNEAYREIAESVHAFQRVYGKAKYEAFIRELNEVIATFNSIRRKKRKASKKNKEPEK